MKPTMKELGDIWGKLNYGVPIERLSVKEQEFLCAEYGEKWRDEVEGRLVEKPVKNKRGWMGNINGPGSEDERT